MALQLSWHLFPHLGAVVTSLFVTGIGVHYRNHTATRSLAVLMLAVAWWSVADMIALGTTDLTIKILMSKLAYPVVAIVPVAWVVFATQYASQDYRLSLRELGALLIVPGLITLLTWTNEYHGLIWSSIDPVSSGSLVVMTDSVGPAFWVHTVYSYVLVAVGTGIILRTALVSDGIYRDQAVALTFAALLPLAGNTLHTTGFIGALDPTKMALALSGVFLTWVIHRRHLLQLVPVARDIARDEVFSNMATAVIIVDEDGQVADFNASAKRIIGHMSPDIVGRPLNTVLPEVATILDSPVPESANSFDVSLSVDGAEQIYDAQVTPLERGYGTITGQVITLNNVTEREKREQRLTQQRQRLKVTNRVLRHDIRNDMTVILGNAEMLLDAQQTETYAHRIIQKGEEIVELSEKAQRLEALDGQGSSNKRALDIVECVERTVADLEQAWPDAEFQLERPNQADAYATGLVSLAIKNVIENAVKHNDKSVPKVEVTITKSTSTAQSIVIDVADNGPGIPDQEREVFEEGTETRLKHSRGLGLWLVFWIVTHSGGTIEISENKPRGSIVTIRLPSAESKTDLA
ncbi:histidine kinase N-terminal 7TM domain-containing protein [Haloarcula amylolytica]|uniref:histidine kinase n=1 Tax=Haloarcula amylolytica JCM 13557 TaxID=1227452 RepID=M0JYZ2_9EURY|nr:histidine kinase N-terminal 7TM domain-containing protein [Haloarcula amylolytica]EMA14201.1 PAS/PAC sensing his kinase [Haloarcula amylolytica JCM 13557]